MKNKTFEAGWEIIQWEYGCSLYLFSVHFDQPYQCEHEKALALH